MPARRINAGCSQTLRDTEVGEPIPIALRSQPRPHHRISPSSPPAMRARPSARPAAVRCPAAEKPGSPRPRHRGSGRFCARTRKIIYLEVYASRPMGTSTVSRFNGPVAFGSRKPVTAPLLPGSRSRALPTFQGPAGGLDGSPVLFGETPYRHDTRRYISSAVTRQDPAGLRAVCTRGAIRLWQDCKIRIPCPSDRSCLIYVQRPQVEKRKIHPWRPRLYDKERHESGARSSTCSRAR